MRRKIFPRILGVCALYGAIFVCIAMIQFSRHGVFNRRLGELLVTGQFAPSFEAGEGDGEYPLAAGARAFFGGLEFFLGPETGDEAFSLLMAGGNREAALPEIMAVSGDMALFRFPGGTELAFLTHREGEGAAELRINAAFGEGVQGLELPWDFQRRAQAQAGEDGRLTVAFNGLSYRFSRPGPEGEPDRRVLTLTAASPAISYGPVSGGGIFSPGDYTLAAAQGKSSFEEVLSRWRDRNFSLWGAATRMDEDTAIAYASEALSRGGYRTALAVSAPVLTGRTYESSVYFGRMEEALRSLSRTEAERLSRLGRVLEAGSPDFFRESHGIEFLALRGENRLAEEAGALALSLDPAALGAELLPGIFEGWGDWKIRRPGGENPFEPLIEGALQTIAGDMRKGFIEAPAGNSGFENRLVLFCPGGEADTELNLRLGKALAAWAESAGDEAWAALGRSLVLSVLSLQNSDGTSPGALHEAASGTFAGDSARDRISAARLYRLLGPGEYQPHAAGTGDQGGGLWAWTASPSVSVQPQGEDLDITVDFSQGETHYMLIRGVRPFVRIQLYGIDFRSDPQFERYDSSGWTYSASERTLMVKMRHREAREHIRIIYTQPPPRAAPPQPAPPDEGEAANQAALSPETASPPPPAL